MTTTSSKTVNTANVTIRIQGLAQLNRSLKTLEAEIPKAVGRMHKNLAGYVARLAKSYARSRPRKQHMGHIEPTITARGTANKASVAAGGARARDVFVQEFGGRVPVFGHPTRKALVRAHKKDGWFLFPAVKEARPRIESMYFEALQRTIDRHT